MKTNPHEDLIGKHIVLVARPENFTSPTKNPNDCICGAKGDATAGRRLIANCPCCDGIQTLSEELCDCTEGHKIRVILPPDSTMRIRYIDTLGAIS